MHRLSDPMDQKTCYQWGNLFASPWEALCEEMESRAHKMGLSQIAGDRYLDWNCRSECKYRFLFVDDLVDRQAIREIKNNNDDIFSVPLAFIVLRQPNPSETRGDIIFDIFRLSAQSYLWHFYRVYTPPK